MALNPVVFTEKVLQSFLRYQLRAYPFADPRLHGQIRSPLRGAFFWPPAAAAGEGAGAPSSKGIFKPCSSALRRSLASRS